MRLLWSLPKAAPVLLKHLGGYAELAHQDIEQMQRDLSARMLAAVLVGACLFFVIFCGCLMVVALTWETPHRVSAIAWMGAVFLILGALALAYRFQVVKGHGPFLGTMRSEWQADRAAIDEILSAKKE